MIYNFASWTSNPKGAKEQSSSSKDLMTNKSHSDTALEIPISEAKERAFAAAVLPVLLFPYELVENSIAATKG